MLQKGGTFVLGLENHHIGALNHDKKKQNLQLLSSNYNRKAKKLLERRIT